MATKKIKGITVEIGGDTQKLDKALQGVNKNISDTTKSLKDVERLLKLDPKNVELLDQKQRLLAQSAEQTADKLKTIQEVVENSTASNVRYEQWTKTFAAMQGQITKTENALDALDKKKKELENLGFSMDSAPMVEVQQEIDDTTDRLEALQQKVKDTYEEMGRPISIDQYDELQRELARAADEAENAEKAFNSFHPTLEKIGSTAQDVSDKAGKVADAFAPISKAAGVALGAMIATVPATEELRSDLSKLGTNAQNAGIGLNATKDALTQFNRVSGETDSSVEALSNLLMAGATESNLQRAVENLAGAAIAFPDTMKIESLADSLQETIATGEATGQFAELLDRLGVSTERFNAQIGQTRDYTVRLNMSLDALSNEGMADYYNSWIKNNEELAKNKDATLEMQMSLSRLAEALTPIVTTVTDFAAKLLDWFADIGPGGQTAIVTILALVASISPIAGMISNIGGAVGTLTKLAGVFAGGAGNSVYLTFAKWALIIMAVVAAVAALIAMINVLIGKGGEANQVLGNLNGRGGGGGGGSSYPVNIGVPGFATGGVFMPNHPVLGVLGDNRQEPEIAAPRSAMQEAFLDALDRRGGAGGGTKVNIEFRGSLAQLGRVLQPVITTETARQGVNLLKG